MQLQELIEFWDSKSDKKLAKYKLLYKAIENQFTGAIRDNNYSMLNLMGSYRAFEEQAELKYLGNFIR